MLLSLPRPLCPTAAKREVKEPQADIGAGEETKGLLQLVAYVACLAVPRQEAGFDTFGITLEPGAPVLLRPARRDHTV